MLYDAADSPGQLSPAELRAAYESEVRAAVRAVGVETAAAEAGVDVATVAALVEGDAPALTLAEAAALLATAEGTPPADHIVAEVRDHLLMAMSTAVLDVDTIAAAIDSDLTGQEVQQALEGRIPLPLADLAAIHRVIAARNDR